MDPDSFAASFDLLHELANNRDEYSSDEMQMSVYHFPSSLLMLIDQTREQVPKGVALTRPSRNSTIVCCLSYGIGILGKHEDIQELFRLKRKMNVITTSSNGHPKDLEHSYSQDSVLIQSIWDVFQQWGIESKDNSKSSRQGLYVSKKLKQAVSAVKTDLSLSLDSLVSICLQIAIHDQDWVLDELKTNMESNIGQFFRAARIRRRIFEVLLKELEK
jgi:hypothetical protein